MVFDLIQIAEAEGWLKELCLGAKCQNPNSPYLQSVCLSTPTDEPENFSKYSGVDLFFAPYLLNREGQKEEFRKMLRKVSDFRSRPLICVVHGYDDQCIEKFTERLRKIDLPKLCSIRPEDKVSHFEVDWPKTFTDVRELHEDLNCDSSSFFEFTDFCLKLFTVPNLACPDPHLPSPALACPRLPS